MELGKPNPFLDYRLDNTFTEYIKVEGVPLFADHSLSEVYLVNALLGVNIPINQWDNLNANFFQ